MTTDGEPASRVGEKLGFARRHIALWRSFAVAGLALTALNLLGGSQHHHDVLFDVIGLVIVSVILVTVLLLAKTWWSDRRTEGPSSVDRYVTGSSSPR